MFDYMESIRTFPGRVGFYLHWPDTGETQEFQADLPMEAASVIKIPIMVTAFRDILDGALDPAEELEILPEMKKPSCGALTYLHDGVEVTVRDLAVLMIILSDNTATNLLIDRLGTENINRAMADLGLSEKTKCRRKLFEPELSARGIQNHVTAADIGLLLKRMLRGEAVSPEASAEMLGILRDQRLNGKMPFHLKPRGIACAHKTGEDYDDGITHDVGIIYAEHPILFCFLAEGADVPEAERALQDLALMAAGI